MTSRFQPAPAACTGFVKRAAQVAILAFAPIVAHAQINPFVQYRGPHLPKADIQAGEDAALRLLRQEPKVGAAESWSGSSGNSGSFTVERVYRRQGRDCRDLRSRINYKAGTKRSFLLHTCEVNGQWKLVD